MMLDCQMYSLKVALSKIIINCSNHDFILEAYRTDTFSSWKYTISNYDCKFRCSIGIKYITNRSNFVRKRPSRFRTNSNRNAYLPLCNFPF
jgi:hypothetical protein